MDELIDILDVNGNFTGQTAMKSEAHLRGLFHATVHIWFYTSDGKLLIQQRAKNKDTHPLLWDVSVAGHIGADENMELSAVREIEEEIGLSILESNLQKIGIFKSVYKHSENLIDCEFHHTYLCELKVPLKSLKKQKSEVEAIDLITLIQFSEEILNMGQLNKYVPHKRSYYKTIITAVTEKINF